MQHLGEHTATTCRSPTAQPFPKTTALPPKLVTRVLHYRKRAVLSNIATAHADAALLFWRIAPLSLDTTCAPQATTSTRDDAHGCSASLTRPTFPRAPSRCPRPAKAGAKLESRATAASQASWASSNSPAFCAPRGPRLHKNDEGSEPKGRSMKTTSPMVRKYIHSIPKMVVFVVRPCHRRRTQRRLLNTLCVTQSQQPLQRKVGAIQASRQPPCLSKVFA